MKLGAVRPASLPHQALDAEVKVGGWQRAQCGCRAEDEGERCGAVSWSRGPGRSPGASGSGGQDLSGHLRFPAASSTSWPLQCLSHSSF